MILELGTDPATGKRRQETLRRDPATGLAIPTKRRAQEIEREELTKRRRGDSIDPSHERLADYLERWLRETAGDHTPSTHYGWTSIIRSRINPALGDIPLGRLTELHISAFYREQRKTYAANSVHAAHTILSAALRAAVRWRLVTRNVATGAVLPPRETQERMAWTAEQTRTFLAITEGRRWGALWRLLLDSGMRIGEALALSWPDVDFAAATVSVAKTVAIVPDASGVSKRAIVHRTKSKSGRRVVGLAPATMDALRRHRTAQLERRLALGPYWHGQQDLVFPSDAGVLVDQTVVGDGFARDIAACGIEDCTPHVLRHTSATLAVAAGEPLHAVAKRLGHANIHLTAQLYAHASVEADRKVSDTLARVLEG